MSDPNFEHMCNPDKCCYGNGTLGNKSLSKDHLHGLAMTVLGLLEDGGFGLNLQQLVSLSNA